MTKETGNGKPGNSNIATLGKPTRWGPGQSGNPNGRPKKVINVLAVAKDGSEKAINKLVKLIGSRDEKTALAAAIAVLDRAVGKPKQSIETTAKQQLARDLTDDELINLARECGTRAIEEEKSKKVIN